MSIRVRFAPSPTGHIHVGNARTAIFNYFFARANNGVFILRIEDTDLERSTLESEQIIYEDLQWLGLDWDEGPLKGGSYGPYRQTERFDIYNRYTMELLKKGLAYECFCSKEELDASREKSMRDGVQPIYNGKCRGLSNSEKEDLKNKGIRPSIRFKTVDRDVVVHDIIKGDVTFPTNVFGDFVIVRPDGVPVYNYAVVIDDALMKISHVIRGDDHLSNTPKQILIYEALGFDIPHFAHIPMILGPDHSKLSKRHGDTSLNLFKEKGYLPEALFNFMTLLSWSAPDDREILTKDETISLFSLDKVSKSPAVFDFAKLKWMNGHYIRNLSKDQLAERVKPFLHISDDFKTKYNDRIADMIFSIKDKIEFLSEADDWFKVYTSYPEAIEDEGMEFLKLPTTKDLFELFISYLKPLKTLELEKYKEIIHEIQSSKGVKGKALFMALRVGITGTTKGPDLDKICTLLYPDDIITRLKKSLEKIC
ncbi:MAG: glutamate--tRNA ligase [Calditerrivibrio sp.]|nr:glutamate--tRNA ligase [Calditerrivibrio sp.]MCA1932188.1 glutamate--tRNA ligase [Calditerrivibrio sp.]